MSPILNTARLRLEPFDDKHFSGLLALNSDPVVMRFVGGAPVTPEEVQGDIDEAKHCWASLGFSWWAILVAGTDDMIGAGCVQHIENDSAKPVEVGWRLRPDQWGRGYATEAARTMIDFAFEVLHVRRIYAVADPMNDRSIKVMRRLGMRYIGLQEHYGRPVTTYALDRSSWQRARQSVPARS
jgi:RimJ/RimL family protein N-acetyltransferase